MRRRTRTTACLGVVAVAAVVLGAWSARWTSVGKGEALSLLPIAGGDAAMVTHRSRTYTIDVPREWRMERRGGAVHWTDPKVQRALRITPVGGEPLAGLRASAHATETSGLYPGYRLLRLEALPGAERPATSRSRPAGRATAAAEWEFTWGTDDRRTHVLRSRTAGYEFAFHAPDSRWTPSHRLYERILSTFATG
jgi:hypothetical protein